jgi:tetratricopeptide (TPR) repeat protein
VARSGNVGSKVKTQTIVKRPKGQKPEIAINTTETNEKGDLQAKALLAGLLILAAALLGGGLFWTGSRLYAAVMHAPVDWVSVAFSVTTIAIMFFVARSLVWLSYFGAILFASKAKAWRSQESLCRQALGLWRVIPGAASTAALALAQNLLGQEKYDEAIKVAEEQWQRFGSSAKADQNLALLCATVGLAYQMRGNARESVSWNERSIEGFKALFEQVANPKGMMAKLASTQSSQWVGPMRMHMAVVYLHNANAYFGMMNYRQAKENYKRAVDAANQAPDSNEKREVLNVAREQMSRLKHA